MELKKKIGYETNNKCAEKRLGLLCDKMYYHNELWKNKNDGCYFIIYNNII